MYKAILYFKKCCCNRVLADKITCLLPCSCAILKIRLSLLSSPNLMT